MFNFNSTHSKPYKVRGVSPMGNIYTAGPTLSFRRRVVKEIANDLPPLEEFDRECYYKLRRKYFQKVGDKIGRIIYNIYYTDFMEYME